MKDILLSLRASSENEEREELEEERELFDGLLELKLDEDDEEEDDEDEEELRPPRPSDFEACFEREIRSRPRGMRGVRLFTYLRGFSSLIEDERRLLRGPIGGRKASSGERSTT
jgi:hypothetical protein